MDYTNLYDFLTSSGVIVPNDKSVLLGIQTKFQEIFGTDIDLSAETPVGRLIEAFAVVVKSTLGVTAQTANQFNVNEATGIYLDAIGQIYNLKRIPSTKTKIRIKCFFNENSSGTDTIPAGSLIMCSANGAMFRIDGPIANDGSNIDESTGLPYAMGTATAVSGGPILAPPGTVNSIQTSVLGWVGVTNISPTYTGTDLETDEAFRKRILESRPIGIGFDTHFLSAVKRLDGVYSACLLENNTGTAVVKKNVTIPPHSIFVCLDFVETDELIEQIADVILTGKPVGTGMVNSGVDEATLYTKTVNYGYGEDAKQTIDFYRAKKTAILVSVKYSVGNYSGDNIESDISDIIAEYIDTIGVGGAIKSTMIANVLINKLNIGVGTIWIQKSGGTPSDSTIEMFGYETPYTVAENITLTNTD